MKDCIFCKIANGIIPSSTVYEDDDFRVIMDISPASEGHMIILPKEHASNVYELKDEMLRHIENKHHVYLPCKIRTDQDFDHLPLAATVCVPIFWDGEAIENYTQALLDEIFLFKQQLPGHKTLQQIEQSFMLEMIVL